MNIIGVPHVDFGEAVVAVCVLEDALQASDTLAQTIGERLRNELAGYKRPKRSLLNSVHKITLLQKL
jgi:acyl-CoA synthetase (AMP-forming)/AMP-acid ligase II